MPEQHPRPHAATLHRRRCDVQIRRCAQNAEPARVGSAPKPGGWTHAMAAAYVLATMRIPLALSLLALPALGQTQHYVDATGAGGAFTTLQAAVAAAVNGDVIRVRPTGVYDFGVWVPPVTVSKGLTIVRDGAVSPEFIGDLTVTNLPASQRVVLRGFSAYAPGADNPATILISNCQGAVVLEQMAPNGRKISGAGAVTALTVTNSTDVTLHDCSVNGWRAMVTTGSTLAVSQSTIAGFDASYFQGIGGTPGITSTSCQWSLVDTVVRGGAEHAAASIPGDVAMRLTGGALRMAGGTIVGGGSASAPIAAATLSAGASLVLDSAVAVTQAITGGTPVIAESGRVSFTSAAPGQNASFGFAGPAGSTGALFCGLPIPPTPTIFGRLWCDPNAYFLVGFDLLPLSTTLQVPAYSQVSDVFVVQGLLFDQGQMVFSNPVRAPLH